MEKKGINIQYRAYPKSTKKINIKNSSNKKHLEKQNEIIPKFYNNQFTFKQNYNDIEKNPNKKEIIENDEKIILDNITNNNNDIIEEDLEQEKKEEEKSENINKIEDDRLNLVIQKLGLEALIPTFQKYNMSFNDLLFLNEDDFKDLGLKILEKNRLKSFIKEFKSNVKSYNLDDIKLFFEKNSLYNI